MNSESKKPELIVCLTAQPTNDLAPRGRRFKAFSTWTWMTAAMIALSIILAVATRAILIRTHSRITLLDSVPAWLFPPFIVLASTYCTYLLNEELAKTVTRRRRKLLVALSLSTVLAILDGVKGAGGVDTALSANVAKLLESARTTQSHSEYKKNEGIVAIWMKHVEKELDRIRPSKEELSQAVSEVSDPDVQRQIHPRVVALLQRKSPALTPQLESELRQILSDMAKDYPSDKPTSEGQIAAMREVYMEKCARWTERVEGQSREWLDTIINDLRTCEAQNQEYESARSTLSKKLSSLRSRLPSSQVDGVERKQHWVEKMTFDLLARHERIAIDLEEVKRITKDVEDAKEALIKRGAQLEEISEIARSVNTDGIEKTIQVEGLGTINERDFAAGIILTLGPKHLEDAANLEKMFASLKRKVAEVKSMMDDQERELRVLIRLQSNQSADTDQASEEVVRFSEQVQQLIIEQNDLARKISVSEKMAHCLDVARRQAEWELNGGDMLPEIHVMLCRIRVAETAGTSSGQGLTTPAAKSK